MKKVSGDNIPPNDVLIVGQRVSNGCVMTVMRTLGETREPILPMHLMAEITFQGGGGGFCDLGSFRIWQRRLLVVWCVHIVPITQLS